MPSLYCSRINLSFPGSTHFSVMSNEVDVACPNLYTFARMPNPLSMNAWMFFFPSYSLHFWAPQEIVMVKHSQQNIFSSSCTRFQLADFFTLLYYFWILFIFFIDVPFGVSIGTFLFSSRQQPGHRDAAFDFRDDHQSVSATPWFILCALLSPAFVSEKVNPIHMFSSWRSPRNEVDFWTRTGPQAVPVFDAA